MLEKAASHKLAFLHILHLLLECPAICDLLEASLAAQVGHLHMHCIRKSCACHSCRICSASESLFLTKYPCMPMYVWWLQY